MSNITKGGSGKPTYFIFHSHHGNSFLYRFLNSRANSSSVVLLLLALSQVNVTQLCSAMRPIERIIFVNQNTLCAMPTRSNTLNKALSRCFPLCALLTFVKPRRALLHPHTVDVFSSIQCPVTAK